MYTHFLSSMRKSARRWRRHIRIYIDSLAFQALRESLIRERERVIETPSMHYTVSPASSYSVLTEPELDLPLIATDYRCGFDCSHL